MSMERASTPQPANDRRHPRILSIIAVGALVSLGRYGHADPTSPAVSTETAPTAGPPGDLDVIPDVERDIDLANVVLSAAKSVETVQEAPAIISVITAADLQARGHKWVLEALSTLPGWSATTALGNQVEAPLVRGVGQAALLLRDGVSLFEPWANIGWFTRTQPIETIKRIEVVTGPGGVLWGANSFLGVVNLISKDARDVDGLEASASYGDGNGNKQDFKGYFIFGKSFFNGALGIFQHVSYETFLGAVFDKPQFIVSSPGPQPSGTAFYGLPVSIDPQRSWMVLVDGKYTLGPVSLYYMLPFGDVHPNMVFANSIAPNDTWSIYDRYGILEYKSRHLGDRLGITAKGYLTQFVRDFTTQLFPESALLPEGIRFSFAGQRILRFGGAIDADVRIPRGFELLLGGEAFDESIANANEVFTAPSDPNQLPLVCPVSDTPQHNRLPGCLRGNISDSSRVVAAAYADLRWRPSTVLMLDGGVRLQSGFGALGYGLQPLYSAALSWRFLPDYYFKANYATGFRPPVFNNTSTISGGIDYGANPGLRNETSQALQGELNVRTLKSVRRIRELELRLDYSYTVLGNLIQIRNNFYVNAGERAMHSAEALARLYLQGDHSLQASYTYLYSVSSDTGLIRTLPNHWFVVAGTFNVIRDWLDVNLVLHIFGAYEDPDRYPSSATSGVGTTSARTSDLTFDRLTPVALLQLGFRVRLWHERVAISGQFYNVLNQHYYYSDNFADLTPAVETSPTPAPGFSFFATARYRF